MDEIIKVTNEDAFDTARAYAKGEGILVGVSSGAAIFAGISVAKTLGKDKKVIVIAPDGGEKYFSVGLYE